jgi:hypothetical protein
MQGALGEQFLSHTVKMSGGYALRTQFFLTKPTHPVKLPHHFLMGSYHEVPALWQGHGLRTILRKSRTFLGVEVYLLRRDY